MMKTGCFNNYLIESSGLGIKVIDHRVPMQATALCFVLAFLTVFSLGNVYGETGSTAGSSGKTVLRAKGEGKPRAGCTDAQARLLAKRAATLSAYRNLLKRVGDCSGSVEKGTGHVSVDGYIKGAFVDEVRYYSDGRVVVVLGLPVGTKDASGTVSGTAAEAGPEGEYRVERPGTEISEKEWKSLDAVVQ